MRLSRFEIKSIKETVKEFDPEARVYLFGSRTDDAAKGGDIDILIVSEKIKNREKRKIRLKIFDRMEEQKIDIISTAEIKGAFIEFAYKNGIRL